ncbi:MAG: formylglycine-generating enzyme family protein [Myxococcota bacterium]
MTICLGLRRSVRGVFVAVVLGFGCGGDDRRGAPTDGSMALDAAAMDAPTLADGSRAEGGADGGDPVSRGFVRVSSGTYTLGSPPSEPCRVRENETQREITLTRDFEIAETEVTEGDYVSRVANPRSPIDPCGDDCPVNLVSWHEAAAYCNALSRERGVASCYSCTGSEDETRCEPVVAESDSIYDCAGYRLPTEAEWEVAYRAGTTTMTPAGNFDSRACPDCGVDEATIDEIAISCHNSEVSWEGCRDLSFFGGPACAGRQPVRQTDPNPLGIYDMAGNLDEWCHDEYVVQAETVPSLDPVSTFDPATTFASTRTVRGGSWTVTRNWARAASRAGANSLQRLSERGFRCARTLNQ